MPFTDPDHLHAEFAAALRARDVDALVEMYEVHAVQLQPGGSVSDDRSALRAMFDSLVDQGPLPDVPQRLAITLDDLSLTSTTYVFPGADGGETTMTTAEVSRRQADGTWRVAIDAPTFVTSRAGRSGVGA